MAVNPVLLILEDMCPYPVKRTFVVDDGSPDETLVMVMKLSHFSRLADFPLTDVPRFLEALVADDGPDETRGTVMKFS